MNTTADHRHYSTQPATILGANGEVVEIDNKCETCGRSMREIKAERDAQTRTRAPRERRRDDRTFEQKEIDRERRRDRYHRTGR